MAVRRWKFGQLWPGYSGRQCLLGLGLLEVRRGRQREQPPLRVQPPWTIIDPRSVINWIEQNLLPCYRTPCGHRRIRREDLLVFVRRQKIPTPATLVESKFTVLIVDDDQNIVDLIRTFLLHQGSYQVASVSDGISALIEVGRIKPELLILHLKIPGVDGIEVCRRIKSDSANRTAIIAVSGSSEYGNTSLQSGADAFMLKPVGLERLHVEIKRLLPVL